MERRDTSGGTSGTGRPPLYLVFVSSTAEDLSEWRAAVIDTLSRMDDVKPVYQEAFGSRGGPTVDECRELAASADAVVVIVAHRYGWVPTEAEGGDGERSITRLEVDAALAADVPVLAFIVDELYGWEQAKEQDQLTSVGSDPDAILKVGRRVAQLTDFKKQLHGRIRATFKGPEDLASKVATSVQNTLRRTNQRTDAGPSWIPGSRPLVFPQFVGVPDRNPLFVGRDADLAALEDAGGSADATVITQAVVGMGGVGKTTLAVEFCHRHRHDYDMIRWLPAENRQTLEVAYQAIAPAVGLQVDGLAPTDVFARIRQWFETTEHTWLPAFDNVVSPDVVTQLLPTSGHGRVLITSRHGQWAGTGVTVRRGSVRTSRS